MSELRSDRLGDDVAAKPALLRSFADDDPTTIWVSAGRPERVLLVGMGSSYFAASVAARRLRAAGVTAVAERASIERAWPMRESDLAVIVSSGGSSVETVRAAEGLSGDAGRVVALTNAPSSAVAELAGAVVDLAAGVEVSGVSVRSFAATLVRLLQLEVALCGEGPELAGFAARLRAAADAVDELIGSSREWIDDAVDQLAGPAGTWLLGPAERISSALQGALMLREGPRRAADGCETGDWSHVDVYLTKTLDYRAVVFGGSRWDEPAAEWMRARQSTFWSVGTAIEGAARVVRYTGDTDPIVALLAETTVAELLAARLATIPS